jgi:hypothetical protein
LWNALRGWHCCDRRYWQESSLTWQLALKLQMKNSRKSQSKSDGFTVSETTKLIHNVHHDCLSYFCKITKLTGSVGAFGILKTICFN